MIEHKNLKIIAFVGLSGAGKSTVIEYLNGKGYPNVTQVDLISQIHHLANSGQHRIVTDELVDANQYHILKHEFPGSLHLIAIVGDKRDRHHRQVDAVGVPIRESDASKEDYEEVEHESRAELIALADHFIENDGNKEALYKQVEHLFGELGLGL